MMNLIKTPVVRKLAWKVGRRLYLWARHDTSNNPINNGEYWLIEKLLNQPGEIPILMDVGANKGDWTAKVVETMDCLAKAGKVFAFEPTKSTFEFLSERFMEEDDKVETHNIALSKSSGEQEFFVVGELAGTNSFAKIDGATVEKVKTQTFDNFLIAANLKNILFVKSDTEGFDMDVLVGAKNSLKQGLIEVWQFEYNHRWISNHYSLQDVFCFIEDMPYRLGKLYGNGIEIYEGWHPEMERYFESNYVLIRNRSEMEKLSAFVHFDSSNVLVSSEQ